MSLIRERETETETERERQRERERERAKQRQRQRRRETGTERQIESKREFYVNGIDLMYFKNLLMSVKRFHLLEPTFASGQS